MAGRAWSDPSFCNCLVSFQLAVDNITVELPEQKGSYGARTEEARLAFCRPLPTTTRGEVRPRSHADSPRERRGTWQTHEAHEGDGQRNMKESQWFQVGIFTMPGEFTTKYQKKR